MCQLQCFNMTSFRFGRRRLAIGVALISVLVLSSRLPLLDAGFGRDPDAWRTFHDLEEMLERGNWLPRDGVRGHPFQLLVYALTGARTPLAMNGLTAVASVLAAVCFFLILDALHSREALQGALALSFTPIVYANSTTTMDYLWALAFLLVALYLTLRDRPLWGGLCLGLAIGCRITSAAMTAPLCLLLFRRSPDRRRALRSSLSLVSAAAIPAIVLFLPGLLQRRSRFFSFPEPPYPSLSTLVERATSEVWGEFGLLAIVICLVVPWALRSRQGGRPSIDDGRLPVVWLVGIFAYLLLFLRLPAEAGYLVPVVPLVLLFLAHLLRPLPFTLLAILLCASSFVGLEEGTISSGPVFKEQARRRERMQRLGSVVEALERRGSRRLLVVAQSHLRPQLEGQLVASELADADVEIQSDPSREKLFECREKGFDVYYLSGMRCRHLEREGIDLEAFGAQPVLGESDDCSP